MPERLRILAALGVAAALALPGLGAQAALGPALTGRPAANDALCVVDHLESRIAAARAQGLNYVPGYVLVTFQEGPLPMQAAALAAQVNAGLHCSYGGMHTHILRVTPGAEEATVAQLRALPWVAGAQVERIRRVSLTPNDARYSQQWSAAKINLPQAWDITTGAPTVTIAILDSGVDTGHPDFQGQLLPGKNTADDSSNVNDDNGHGTHVAGIAGAAGNNAAGIAGAAYGAKLLPVKVIGADGSGGDSSLAAGIKWAVDNGAKIINMSLGGPDTTPPAAVQDAVNYAHGKGALLFAASGNCFKDGSACDGQINPVIYPAALNNVISVSALSNQDQQASYSQTHETVKLTAPGGDEAASGETGTQAMILSTYPRALDQSGYKTEAGTSQAAPLVAGVAALVWSANPNLTNVQVEDILTRTATHLGEPGRNKVYGYGKVNALAAVQAAKAMAEPAPTPSPTPTVTPTPTATPTATPASAPVLAGPADNAALPGLSAALAWQNPSGTVQFQLQVTPANNDGPAINLIIGAPDQVAAAKYNVTAPLFGQGPYIMLPGMSYQWRVRATAFGGPIDESSPQWGPWSPAKRFRTAPPSAATLSPVSPAEGATVAAGPATVQWADSNPAVFYYEVQMSGDSNFDVNPATATSFVYWNLVHGGVPTPPMSWQAPAGSLAPGSTVYWRVRPRVQGDGVEVAWGPVWSFKTP